MTAESKLHPFTTTTCHAVLLLALVAFSALAALQLFSPAARAQTTHRFEIGEHAFLLDGQPFQIRCGEMHAARVPREYWDHRLGMIRAMGLNAVCAYMFWNMHEPRPGQFNWSAEADIAEFCRLAQKHGLWVILRPGPYACAEWTGGGLPWWLLRDPDMYLRSTYPGFLEPAKRYLREVGRVLAPLQITRGGPIIMVQVENEYGSYGDNVDYMKAINQAMLDVGFDVPLFACNPPAHLRNGFTKDIFQVVNFGSDPKGGFEALRKLQPAGPLMCGEFYPGWFDTWGAPHHFGDPEKYFGSLKYMLEAGASFSIYMAHGGSTFGFWSGCDRPFKPDTSSYDYDAPIDEAGAAREKFHQTREMFRQFLNPGETIPANPPPPNPTQTFAPVPMTQVAPLFKNLPVPAKPSTVNREPETANLFSAPLNFESAELDLPQGCALYRITLPAGPAATLTAQHIADFGFIFLDGRRIGVFDRRYSRHAVEIPARDKPATLDILVEAIGRINFGKEMHDRKGLGGPVRLTLDTGETRNLTGWQIHPLPLDAAHLASLRFEPVPSAPGAAAPTANREPRTVNRGGSTAATAPAFWRTTITLPSQADTWLDMRSWGKGVVWINGRPLGRYWNIGPTQTMYVPGPWLRAGENEIIILDLLDRQNAAPEIAGVTTPILNQLRPALDFARHLRRQTAPSLEGVEPVWTGTFAQGSAPIEIRFKKTVRGRYFCIETLDAHDGKPHAAIAEIELLDDKGAPHRLDGWQVIYADSEERTAADGAADNILDGQTASFWHTEWSDKSPAHPHCLVIDLARKRAVTGLRYTPRQGADDITGRIKNARVYIGDDLVKK